MLIRNKNTNELELHIVWLVGDVRSLFKNTYNYEASTEECEEILARANGFSPDISWDTIDDICQDYAYDMDFTELADGKVYSSQNIYDTLEAVDKPFFDDLIMDNPRVDEMLKLFEVRYPDIEDKIIARKRK